MELFPSRTVIPSYGWEGNNQDERITEVDHKISHRKITKKKLFIVGK